MREKLMSRRRKAVMLGGAAVILAVACLVLLLALLDPYGCRIVEGVSIGGLEIGGMTRREAKAALREAAADTLLAQELEIVLPEETLRLPPERCGLRLSVSKAVANAYRYGRRSQQEEKHLGLLPYLRWEEEPIRKTLEDYGARYNTELQAPSWKLEGAAPDLATVSFDPQVPGQTLKITMGIPKRQLDVEEAYQAVLAFYDQALTVEHQESCELSLEVPPEKVPDLPDLEAICRDICSDPVDDTLDMARYCVVPGAYGQGFDREAAEAKIAQADYGAAVTIPLSYTAPAIMGEGVYFQNELGSCETRHNNNENRNTNLRLICEILDGWVVGPGEDFSYNGVVGERTKERGFKPAPAYSGNRLIQDYGGGACQCSTTLYNCLLLADMEVTDRVCHGAAVGYVPRGLDAAVNWATNTDLAFRNNSHFPVMIRAKVEDGYVKMRLLGTDEKDYYIQMESTSSGDDVAIYAVSYKCKYSKATGELLSRDVEARSTYYKNLG